MPALGGHMPYVDACKRLVGHVTQVSLSKARLQCVPRSCVFPNSQVPRLELMLPGGSAEAWMGEKELGRALAARLDSGLTEKGLADLLNGLTAHAPPTLPTGRGGSSTC